MAKRSKTVFMCRECGYESPRWIGQCICGAWNSMVEEKVLPIKNDIRRRTGTSVKEKGSNKVQALKNVSDATHKRLDTGIDELNRVLGGGLVLGSLTLISGEPGIGKSTMILQVAGNISNQGKKVLYISGEESEEQIKMRADRVCNLPLSENLYILAETNIESMITVVDTLNPDFVIIDSIQTMYTEEIDSVPGSVSQVRASGNAIMKMGKQGNIPIFIVAHVTKSGDLAGPKIVEHLVDTVLSFGGERNHELRILRAFKNRFGSTSEIGAFKMEEAGLKEIENLSGTFLEDEISRGDGSIITSIYEGSRPILLEIQSLTAPANTGFPRRAAIGVDNQRLNMLLAVLEKKAGISTGTKDVYVNVVGGYKADSTSVDLAIILAIFSAKKSIQTKVPFIALGEVGLTGEIRGIQHLEKIIGESVRMGYKVAIIPAKNANKICELQRKGKFSDIQIIGVKNIKEAIISFQKMCN